MTFIRGEFTRYMRDKSNPTQRGYIGGPFGIHRHQYSNTWSITHLATGRFITDGPTTLKNAKQVAQAIESLADWTLSNPLARLTESERNHIRQTIKDTIK